MPGVSLGEVFLTTGICEKCSAKLLAELEPTPVPARLRPEPFESRGGTYYGHYGV